MVIENQANFDVVTERYLLSQALLTATANMASSTEPEAVLKSICDNLSQSTRCINLAWMILDNLDVDILSPDYMAGGATDCASRILIDRDPLVGHCPVREAIKSRQAVTRDLDNANQPPCDVDLLSVVSLPVGKQDSEHSGVITLYSSMPGYFDLVGMDFFSAFIHLANASLEQSSLLNDLTHMASHDLLTGIYNRRGIQECLEHELAYCRRNGRRLSIILFDLDRFKLINDRLGHKEGDLVLKGVSQAAGQVLRNEDYLGRWGGEEFICVITDANRNAAMQLAERMRQHIKEASISVTSTVLNVTASLGVSSYPEDGDTIDKLVAAADAALYQAKRAGRDRALSAEVIQQDVYSLCNMLDSALEENRIVPAYQPIVDLRTGKVVAEEALARLQTPKGEVIEAEQFIDAAHQLQLLHRIDQAVINQAFTHCVVGLETGENRLDHFVNISADLLRHTELVDELLASAQLYCSSCNGKIGAVKPMVIEITERELLSDIEMAKELLMPFIDFGLRLALDDFGSGYSSYQYLADLPVDFLKIDGALVKRVNEPKVRAIVQGIQDTADALSITTLAEFVENQETESILKDIGVHWAQGHYYGKPKLTSLSESNNPSINRLRY